MKKLIAVVLLLGYGAVQAASVNVDFEDIVGSPIALPATFGSQGFTFTLAIGAFAFSQDGPQTDTGIYVGFAPDNSVPLGFSMQSTNGDLFSLLSFDVGFAGPAGIYERPLTVTGVFADASEISATFDSIGVWLETVNLGPGWDNLVSVDFSIDSTNLESIDVPIFDNIAVDVVPIPAAVWLFGSGLGLLGWFRHGQS